MRFSANISSLFKDLPFGDRFRRAADAGFRAVEFMRPGADQIDVVERAIAVAAERARAQGASIVIEAINSYENGPYLLDTTAKAVSLLDAVGADLEDNPSTATTEERLGWMKELGYA
jgi:hydroxypyruvate isomerase